MESTLTRSVRRSYGLAAPNAGDFLSFYGVVKDDDAAVVAGAVVMVSACFEGGVESSLGYTFTDRKGTYFISIPKPQDYNLLTGFKVRAAKAVIPPEETDYPESFLEKAASGFEQNIIQQEQPKEEFYREYLEGDAEEELYQEQIEILNLPVNYEEKACRELGQDVVQEQQSKVEEPFWENSLEESFEEKYNELQHVPVPVDESRDQDTVNPQVENYPGESDYEDEDEFIYEDKVGESIYLEQQLDYAPAGNYTGSVAYVQGGEIRITIFGA